MTPLDFLDTWLDLTSCHYTDGYFYYPERPPNKNKSITWISDCGNYLLLKHHSHSKGDYRCCAWTALYDIRDADSRDRVSGEPWLKRWDGRFLKSHMQEALEIVKQQPERFSTKMKITNKHFLPQAMVHAVSHDRYDAGDSDVTVSTLISPSQQFKLKRKHGGETTEDVSDRVWSLIGSAVHYILENACIDMKDTGNWADDSIAEQRFYADVSGKRVSAQIDLFEMGDLNDFKITSVWTIKHAIQEGKDEWDAQLNIQRYLMHRNGIDVKKLYIIAIARDWNKSGNLRDSDYPPRVAKIEIPVWDHNKTEAYIKGRINELYSDHLIPCTPHECWEKPTMYALMKKGRKSALRVLDSNADIIEYADSKDLMVEVDDHKELKSDHYFEVRVGERLRCKDYCEVMPFCDQYKEWLEKNDV